MATTVTKLPAIKNAYVDSSNIHTGYFTSPLELYKKKTKDDYTYEKFALLKFDTSLLPQGKKITGFTLNCYVSSMSYTGDPWVINEKSIVVKRIDSKDIPSIDNITYAKLLGVDRKAFTGNQDLDKINIPGNCSVSLTSVVADVLDVYKDALNGALTIELYDFVSLTNTDRSVSANIFGIGTNNSPTLEVTQEDVAFTVSEMSPVAGFVNRNENTVFSWDIFPLKNIVNFWGELKAKTAKLRWRMSGTSNYNEINVSGNSYTVPINTFGIGNVEWQVEVTSNAGTVATSNWYTVTTIDTDAIATPISPDSVKINRENETVFTWSHTTTYGTNATASELQYSTNAVTWYDLASVEGSELSVTVLADTLPIGTVYWRVRTYNANGVAGAWSEMAAVTVTGKVPTPVISSATLGTAAPEIRWSAELQQAYEVQISSGANVAYESGTKLGTEKSHKVKTLLPDGEYTAKVRVYAENGDISDWAEYAFTISTEKPTIPTISAQPVWGGVRLFVTADATAYILRDGEPIGIARAGEYIDYSSAGQSVYAARAVTSQGTYSDSEAVTAGPVINGSMIAPADDPAAMIRLYLNLNDNPKREMAWSPVGSVSHYAGRKYHVYEYTEQEDESYNYSFAFREAKEYQAFMELVKKRGTILYRDQYGVRYYGVITGVSPGFSLGGYAVSFSVTRVDHKEGVEYDI